MSMYGLRQTNRLQNRSTILDYANTHKCTQVPCMSYQWDPNKAFANLRKHGIDFTNAIEVVSDDSAITIEDTRN